MNANTRSRRITRACLALALVRCAAGQSYPVSVIENPPFEPESAFVLPVGEPEPFVGYRNWDIIILHDPVSIPGLSQSKSYNIWTNRVGIDSIHSVYIVSRVNASTGQTAIAIGASPGERFVNAGSILMSSNPDERTGLVIVGPVNLSGDFLGPLESHRFHLAADGDLAGDIWLASHSSKASTLNVFLGGDVREGSSLVVSTSQNGISGFIERIASTGGAIGSSGSPAIILVDGMINLLRAGELNAIIGGLGTTGAESFVLGIRRIETYTDGGHTGAFTGQIDAQHIENSDAQANWIKFAGPMRGVIRLGYAFVDNSPNPAARNYIQVPTGGLEGQVIMRALGGVEANNPWVRPVYVGNETTEDDLNPKPHYLETSAEIGGGAVGRVPFGTHFTDCFPAQSGTDPMAIPTIDYGVIDDKNPIVISHYGPVILPVFPLRAFKVERRLAGLPYSDPIPWTDETGCFSESLDESGRNVLLAPTGLPLQSGFEYRVSQQLDGSGSPLLQCHGVVLPSPPPPVAHFDLIPSTSDRREFRFTICGPSLGDADNSGCVNFADNTKILEQWGSTACGKDGDANRDGIVDFGDITAVLTNWLFAYCEGTCSASFSQASGDGFSTIGMVDDASAMNSPNDVLLALASLGYLSIESFGLAIANMTDEERVFEMARLQQLLAPNE